MKTKGRSNALGIAAIVAGLVGAGLGAAEVCSNRKSRKDDEIVVPEKLHDWYNGDGDEEEE